jgi:hypothetical protein
MPTLEVTGSTRAAITVRPTPVGSVIIYGRGDELGDFRVFADYLKKDLTPTFADNIRVINIEQKAVFFSYLSNFKESFLIKQLHVFSHSIGGGLFLGYGGSAGANSRVNAYKRAKRLGRNVTYEEVRDAEIDAVLSDDFLNPSIRTLKTAIQSKFSTNAQIKLWGCNAGYEGWVYGDDDWDGDGIPDVYWSMLNTRHIPKPSVANAFAQFFNLKVFGARSGSHVEVFEGGTWITSQEYKNSHGRWANPAHTQHRLQPDHGPYYEYNP